MCLDLRQGLPLPHRNWTQGRLTERCWWENEPSRTADLKADGMDTLGDPTQAGWGEFPSRGFLTSVLLP